MPNNQLIRDHGSIDYEPGETIEMELPRSHYYERLNLLVDYEVTSDGSDGESGYGILDLVDSIEIEFNGASTIKSTSLAMSHFADWLDYGTRPIYDDVDHSSATTQSGQLQTFVDFLLAPGTRGSMLPSFQFSDLVLRVKWGTPSDIGSDITSVDSASIEVQSRERKRNSVPTAAVNDLFAFKERERTVQIDYDGEHQIDLPRGNTYYGLNVSVLDDDSPDNDLIQDVEVVENGVSTHRASTFDLLRAGDKQQYDIEALPTGHVAIDYGFRGNVEDVVSTADMDDFQLLLETDGAPTTPAEVSVVTRELVL